MRQGYATSLLRTCNCVRLQKRGCTTATAPVATLPASRPSSTPALVSNTTGTPEELRRFHKVFAFAAAHVDVSPVKRPLLEGTLSFPLTDDVTVTLVSTVEGTSADEVAAGVRRRALALAAAISASNGSQLPTNPLPFLRQHILLANALAMEQATELDLQIRVSLGVNEGSGCSVRCAVYLTDPWAPLPVEEPIFTSSGEGPQALRLLLAEAGGALAIEIAKRRAALVDDCLREVELRVREATTSPQPWIHTRCKSSQSGVAAVALLSVPGPLSCRARILAHRASGQPLLLECTMTPRCAEVRESVGSTTVTGYAGSNEANGNPSSVVVRCPLVAVTAPESGLVYAAHGRLPALTAAGLAAVHARGELLDSAASAPLCVLDASLSLLGAACPRLAYALAANCSLSCSESPSVRHLTRVFGRPTVNTWLDAHAGSTHSQPPLLPPLPLLFNDGLDHRETRSSASERALLLRHLAYEIGWANAPIVRMEPLPTSVAGATTTIDAPTEGAPLRLFFPSLLAVALDTNAAYAVGQRFVSCRAALTGLASACTSARPASGGVSVPPPQSTSCRSSAHIAAIQPSTSFATDATMGNCTTSAETATAFVDVLDVEEVLRRAGVAHCRYDTVSRTLTAHGSRGAVLFKFHEMDTVAGIARLLRFAGERRESERPYRTVAVTPSAHTTTTLRRLLRASLQGSSVARISKPAPYVRKLLIPLPLSTPPASAVSFSSSMSEMHLVRQLLALVRHFARNGVGEWPLAEPPTPCFFRTWPPTRRALAGLETAFSDVTYTFSPTAVPMADATVKGHGRSSGCSRSAPVKGPVRLTFSCTSTTENVPLASGRGESDSEVKTVTSAATSRECKKTSEHTAEYYLTPGPHFLEEFHRSLANFVEMVAPTSENVGDEAPMKGLRERVGEATYADETDEAVVALSAIPPRETQSQTCQQFHLQQQRSATPSMLPWDALSFYAVPPRIEPGHSRSAALAVLEYWLRSDGEMQWNESTAEYRLLLPVTPTVTVCLVSVPAARIDRNRSWRQQLAEEVLVNGLSVLAPAVAAVREVGELLDTLSVTERTSAVINSRDANVLEGARKKTVSASAALRLKRVACVCHIDDGAICKAEVRVRTVALGGSPPSIGGTHATETIAVTGSGANRLEALLALLPRLRRLTCAHQALLPHAVATDDKGVSTTTDSSLDGDIYSRRAARVRQRHQLAKVWPEYHTHTQELALCGEDSAGHSIMVASLPCAREAVPRVLGYVYKASADTCVLPLYLTETDVTAEEAKEVERARELRAEAALRGAGWMVETIARQLCVKAPAASLVQVTSEPRGRFWIATASLDPSLFGVRFIEGGADPTAKSGAVRTQGNSHGVETEPFVVQTAHTSKRQAAAACLQSLILWIAHAIPERPVVTPASLSMAESAEGPTRLCRARNVVRGIRESTHQVPLRHLLTHPAAASISAVEQPQASQQTHLRDVQFPHEAANPLARTAAATQPRRAVRVKLREDLKPRTQPPLSPATNADMPTVPAPQEQALLAPPLAGVLQAATAAALLRSTRLHGIIFVRLSRLLGVQVMFHADGDEGASAPRSATDFQRQLPKRSGSADANLTAPLLTEPWAVEAPSHTIPSKGCMPCWSPLQILSCIAAAADRSGEPGGASELIIQAMKQDNGKSTPVPWTDAEAVCTDFFATCCGWRVDGGRAKPAAPVSTLTTTALSSPLVDPMPIRVEVSVWRSTCKHRLPGERPNAAARSLLSPYAAEAAASAPFMSTYTAHVRLCQSEAPAAATGATAEGEGRVTYARTLARVDAATKRGALQAVWEQCVDELTTTLGIPAGARAGMTWGQLRQLVANWLNSRL